MPRTATAPEELSAEKVAHLLALAQQRPQLADIPWHDDEAVFDGTPVLRERAAAASIAPGDPRALDALRQRIRDRYISVRFAGIARGAADLENPTRVLKAAWLAFEERQGECALELLRMAIGQNPAEEALRLAELDLAWRLRDRMRFVQAAREFRPLFPASAEWDEIRRAGRLLAPDEPLFASASGAARDDAAPPRWRSAPWDAVPRLEASEFRRAMMVETSHGH